jgi:hypothetical protein
MNARDLFIQLSELGTENMRKSLYPIWTKIYCREYSDFSQPFLGKFYDDFALLLNATLND